MSTTSMTPRFARADLETLSLLWALDRGPAHPPELARRLGLDPVLAPEVERACASLSQLGFAGRVAGEAEDAGSAWAPTARGRALLQDALR